jgi:hypothetical protein
MKSKFLLLSLVTLAATLSSCKEKEPFQGDESNKGCVTGKIIKSEKDRTGTIYFIPGENKYAVICSIPGTYDSQDIGFLCSPPESLRKDGLSVAFDGQYYAYEKDRVPPFGGATYYYLNVSKITLR